VTASSLPSPSTVDGRPLPPAHLAFGAQTWKEIAHLLAGQSALPDVVVAQLLGRSRKQDVPAGLTPREREVLALMAEGRANTAIARQLVVSDGAIEKHGATSSKSSAWRRVREITVACWPCRPT
jgi:FixJ family two-component response regulator